MFMQVLIERDRRLSQENGYVKCFRNNFIHSVKSVCAESGDPAYKFLQAECPHTAGLLSSCISTEAPIAEVSLSLEQLKIERGVKLSRQMAVGCSTRNLARRAVKSVGAALNARRLWFGRFSGSLFSLPVRRFDVLFRRALPWRKGTLDLGCRTLWSLHRFEKAGGFSGGVSPVLREERETVG